MCRNVGLAEMHALKHFSTVRKSAPSPHGINGAQGSVSSPMRIFWACISGFGDTSLAGRKYLQKRRGFPAKRVITGSNLSGILLIKYDKMA